MPETALDVTTACRYISTVNMEWDEDKNRANIRRHRINFADVHPVFDGPMYVTLDTRRHYGEERQVGIGFLHAAVIVVVFVAKADGTIRLTSARKADKHEREKFKEELGH